MDLSDQIVEALRARNTAGETYERMEKSFGVSGLTITGFNCSFSCEV